MALEQRVAFLCRSGSHGIRASRAPPRALPRAPGHPWRRVLRDNDRHAGCAPLHPRPDHHARAARLSARARLRAVRRRRDTRRGCDARRGDGAHRVGVARRGPQAGVRHSAVLRQGRDRPPVSPAPGLHVGVLRACARVRARSPLRADPRPGRGGRARRRSGEGRRRLQPLPERARQRVSPTRLAHRRPARPLLRPHAAGDAEHRPPPGPLQAGERRPPAHPRQPPAGLLVDVLPQAVLRVARRGPGRGVRRDRARRPDGARRPAVASSGAIALHGKGQPASLDVPALPDRSLRAQERRQPHAGVPPTRGVGARPSR